MKIYRAKEAVSLSSSKYVYWINEAPSKNYMVRKNTIECREVPLTMKTFIKLLEDNEVLYVGKTFGEMVQDVLKAAYTLTSKKSKHFHRDFATFKRLL